MKIKSFTLIELIVVIAIIAILSAIVAPNAFRAIEKAKVAKTKSDLEAIKTAIGALYGDTGKFPNGCPAFATANPEIYFDNPRSGLVSKPPVGVTPGSGGRCEWTQSDVDMWDGPYLESAGVRDFWKTSYMYDPDYCMCTTSCSYSRENISSCDTSSAVVEECRNACGGGLNCVPPAIVSFGPDKLEYSCDDIIKKLSLN